MIIDIWSFNCYFLFQETHELRVNQLVGKAEGWQKMSAVTVDKVGVYFRDAQPDEKVIRSQVSFEPLKTGVLNFSTTYRSSDLPSPAGGRPGSGDTQHNEVSEHCNSVFTIGCGLPGLFYLLTLTFPVLQQSFCLSFFFLFLIFLDIILVLPTETLRFFCLQNILELHSLIVWSHFSQNF